MDPQCRESCCVMRNAWQTLTCLSGRAAVIVHGPDGCGADLSLPGRRTSATGLSEMDVVMGGEKALAAEIAGVRRRLRPDVIFVLGTCVSEIIGDDARGICGQASRRLGLPVVFLPTSGMAEKGSGEPAADAVLALVEQVMRPGRRIAGSVNFIAHPWPGYLGIREELARRLRGLGIRLNAMLAGAPSLEEVVRAPRAALNLVVSDEPARRAALLMKERFGTPFLLVPRPLGVGAASRLLALAAEAFGGGRRRAALVEAWRRYELRRLEREHPGLRGRTLRLDGRGPDPAAVQAFAELGIRLARSGARRGPALQVRPPEAFLMYPGMHALAAELEAELGSGFFDKYGRYCR